MRKIYSLFLICFCLVCHSSWSQSEQVSPFIKELAPLAISKDTGRNPQSKTWFYNCKQWAVLPNNDGTFLWRLDGNKWTNVLKLSDKEYKADCKIVDDIAHILLFMDGGTSFLASIVHDPDNNIYTPWPERPKPVGIDLGKEAETATIDIDSKGRMWLASDTRSDITVRWSDAPYTAWSEPITLATGVTPNDICAVTTLSGKIGVFWSDQNKQRFGFRVHNDGADPSNWAADEEPASQSALAIYRGMADDHINMAISSDGTLYCAIKTEYDTQGFPKIALLIRQPSGTWDELYEVSQKGTRPVVLLNEAEKKVKVIYTSQDVYSNIVYKESPTTSIAFSEQKILIKGQYNDATSSKANYTSDIAVLASNGTKAVGALIADGPRDPNCMEPEWAIYPNPFHLKSALYFSLTNGGKYTITIFDGKGARVGQLQNGNASPGEKLIVEIDGAKLARGLYLIRVQTDEKTQSFKVVHEK